MSFKEKQNLDKILVQAVKKDLNQYEKIVNKYWAKLFVYIKRMSYFGKEDIEDILQEVFIKIYRFLNDYDDSMSFATWVYQITRNTVIDEIRKRKKKAVITLDKDELWAVFRSNVNLKQELIYKDLLEKVQKIIYSLPFKYQEIFILRFLEEKNYQEIMDIVKKPKGTISALINRGRKLLIQKAKEQHLI